MGRSPRQDTTTLGRLWARAWPSDPVVAFNRDVGLEEMRKLIDELAWRFVEHVVARAAGRSSCQFAAPQLGFLPSWTLLTAQAVCQRLCGPVTSATES